MRKIDLAELAGSTTRQHRIGHVNIAPWKCLDLNRAVGLPAGDAAHFRVFPGDVHGDPRLAPKHAAASPGPAPRAHAAAGTAVFFIVLGPSTRPAASRRPPALPVGPTAPAIIPAVRG